MINRSNLNVSWEEIMADPPGKNVDLRRDMKLPYQSPKESVGPIPNLLKDQPRIGRLGSVSSFVRMEPNHSDSRSVSNDRKVTNSLAPHLTIEISDFILIPPITIMSPQVPSQQPTITRNSPHQRITI